MLWVVFAVLTGAAVLSVLWPLSRSRRGVSRRDSEVAFFSAQSSEIARDVERGLLSKEDADAARAEAARRLISVADEDAGASRAEASRPRRVAAALAVVLIPALTLGFYGLVGSPDFPDQPLQARLDAKPDRLDIMAAIGQIEKHLSDHPDDGKGYEILAPVYMRIGRAGDAAAAWRNAIRLNGASPDRLESLGEALAFASNGKVTIEAQQAFEAAAAAAPEMPQPQFFLGLAAEQRGEPDQARAIWERLIANAPPGLEWTDMVRERLASLPGAGPASETGKTIAALPPDERLAAIRGMVDGLAARLATDGHDLEGWLKLVRAYSVLKDQDRAHAALRDARRNFSTDQTALKQLDQLAREFGLGG